MNEFLIFKVWYSGKVKKETNKLPTTVIANTINNLKSIVILIFLKLKMYQTGNRIIETLADAIRKYGKINRSKAQIRKMSLSILLTVIAGVSIEGLFVF